MLKTNNTILVIVDVQGKLAQLMHDKERLFDNLVVMVKGARILGLPIIWNEQYPKGLGPTIPVIAELLTENAPLEKLSFSCCGNDAFVKRLDELGRKQVLVVGIEAHVCVYQTVADLLERGYAVDVVADAVSSRTPENKRLGLERMTGKDAGITSVEMALFELLRAATGDEFKQISRLVK